MNKFNSDAQNSIAYEEEKVLKLADIIKQIKENDLVTLKDDFILY